MYIDPARLSAGQRAFLAAPNEEVAAVAPETMVYAASGTRRQAVLAGFSSTSEAYARWSRTKMLETCQLIFAHGVHHIFTILATPGQFAEVGQYRERLLAWIDWGLSGPEAMADFERLGWRVRLLCGDDLPELAPAVERLERTAPAAGAPTLWCLAVPDADAPWRWTVAAIQRSGASSRTAAVRALYGDDVPPVTLYLAFGKPVISPVLLPPLLEGNVNCYWSQRPGYSLTQEELRLILYDYAHSRPTWMTDKTDRAEQILTQRSAWEQAPILGLGRRIGPFWYPN